MTSIWRLVFIACLTILIAACSSTGTDGKYYQDDGPPKAGKGPKPEAVADAVPRDEPLSRSGNSPYQALGQNFVPMKSARGFHEEGYASWYGRKYHGRRTSSGEIYDMYAMTAAHPTLPLPSYVRVRNLDNGRVVVVKVNDRGPFLNNRVIDLSYMAALKLGIVGSGTGRVEVVTVFAGDTPSVNQMANRSASQDTSVNVQTSGTTTPGAPIIATTIIPVAQAAVPNTSSLVSQDISSPVTQRYVLQAGSFASRDNAERLLSRLRQGGYNNIRVTRVNVSGREYHRVQIGPYTDRQSADLIAATIEEFLGSPVSVLSQSSG
ncbi:MAG: lipoprotein [marine bacterium B5-7]|nr:MAG: lipoprotein [marine bacterium B5-7]